MVAGPSDISGNRPLGPENSSPTSDRLSDVKFGTNLDILAEITVREKPLLEKWPITGLVTKWSVNW